MTYHLECWKGEGPVHPPLPETTAMDSTAPSLLSEKHIESLRSIQKCAECGEEMAHGESAWKRVYTACGEFQSEYRCFRCHSGQTWTGGDPFEGLEERRGWDMDELCDSQWGRFDPVAKKLVELGAVPMWTLGELCDLAGAVSRETVSEHAAGLMKRLAEETE